ILIFCLFFSLFFASSLSGQNVLDIKQHMVIKELGDGSVKADFKWSPEMYQAIKERFPTPDLFIQRFLTPDKFEAEPRHIHASYDDNFFKIQVKMDMLGVAKNNVRHWSVEIGDADETVKLIEVSGNQAVFESVEKDPDLITRTETKLTLPPSASDIQFDEQTKILQYTLPLKEYTGDHVKIKCVIRRRSKLMTAIYKLYGSDAFPSLWITKVLFTNEGNVPLRDFQVKFSLGEYSDGFSESSETPLLLPGQNIVEIYRPILSRKCAEISSSTPVKLRILYSYKLPDGEKKEKELVRRLDLLGYRDFVFSSLTKEEIRSFADQFDNADFITAWVTSDDPVVNEFGGMANELARGAGAAVDDEQAVFVSAAIYELMRFNKITYQSPTGLFNAENIQHLKYPRNTLRDKSGTCIDLAIAFGAFAEAQGLNPVLILIPGHCFPGVILPKSGNVLPVEMTLLGGGTRDSSHPFDKAVEVGTQELENAVKNGQIIFIHTGTLKRKGINPPELPILPADALQKWGIRQMEDSPQAPQGPQPQKQASWVRWAHPARHYSLECPDNFSLTQPDDLTTNFISPDNTFMAQVLTVPKNYQGKNINEAELAYLFVSIKGDISFERTTISEPEKVNISSMPGIRREYTIAFNDGSTMYAFSFYLDAGDINFLFGGCFSSKDSINIYKEIFIRMGKSLKPSYTIYNSGSR
ncbi:MAG: hypothetical protein JW928_03095, partial [Candidatus Aureabacteria bacterium]|nr:hypothetical protein [Candidatus Auribacterota bacterium]